MEESQIKRTALMSAYLRGHHAVNSSQKIFDDFLAPRLLTREEQAAFDQGMVMGLSAMNPEKAALLTAPAEAISFMVQSIFPTALFLSRSRYTEDRLVKAIQQGIKQYVILGAGMDTFAFRNPEILQEIEVAFHSC